MWWWLVVVDRCGAPSPPLAVRPRFGVRIHGCQPMASDPLPLHFSLTPAPSHIDRGRVVWWVVRRVVGSIIP